MAIAGTINIMSVGSVDTVVELAARGERLGFTRCWVYDEGLETRDVYVTLSAIALRTGSILVGPGITNPYTRHPGVTAAAVATLDELSDGRAFIAVGAGGTLTLRPLALEWRRPALAVEEMVATMRKLFAGKVVDFEGETVSYSAARLGWGRPDIEIWVAGRGPRIAALGGRLADGVHLSYIHKEFLASTIGGIRAAGDGRHRPPRISYTTALVTGDDAFEQARADLSFRIVDSPPAVRTRIGVTDEEIAALRAGLASGGPAAAALHVRPEWVGQFTLVGNAGECAAELSELVNRHGIDEFQVGLHNLSDAETQMDEAIGILGRT
jgi:5,10-methylenetetrahydromethanopterin reductase